MRAVYNNNLCRRLGCVFRRCRVTRRRIAASNLLLLYSVYVACINIIITFIYDIHTLSITRACVFVVRHQLFYYTKTYTTEYTADIYLWIYYVYIHKETSVTTTALQLVKIVCQCVCVCIVARKTHLLAKRKKKPHLHNILFYHV